MRMKLRAVTFNNFGCFIPTPPILQGYLAHKKLPPPQDRRRTIGTSLLQSPKGRRFLMREVPL